MNTKSIGVILLLCIIGALVYIAIQQRKQSMVVSPIPSQSTPTQSSPIASIDDLSQEMPIITSPVINQRVASPLTVEGTIPAGWMFEGSVPIRILDNQKQIIATGVAKEVVAGTWMSGEPVRFKSTIPFTTSAQTGYLRVEKDNPSGLPENAKQFDLSLLFQ